MQPIVPGGHTADMQPSPYGLATPPGPPRGSGDAVRPSKWWFLVAAGVAVAGIVACFGLIGFTALNYSDRIDGFDRTAVPGSMEVELTSTGGYSIYHEYAGAYDADQRSFDDPLFTPPPRVTVTDPSGDEVLLDVYDTAVTYDSGTHEGEGAFTFSVDEPGVYEITAEEETAIGGSTIAVGRGVGSGLVGGVIAGVLLAVVGVVSGGIMAIVVGVRRSSSRRRMLATAGPMYPGAWGLMAPPPMGQPPMGQPPIGQPPMPGAAPAPWGAPPPAPTPPPPPAPPPPAPPMPRDTPPTDHRATAIDPPSLRGSGDWSRSDVPLPWSADR
jgi:hypothetical protein